jgi:hypothetical protein
MNCTGSCSNSNWYCWYLSNTGFTQAPNEPKFKNVVFGFNKNWLDK